jgi:phage baseplate assembly protein W
MARGAEHLGRDLLVAPFFQADEWQTLDLEVAPRLEREAADLATAAGVDNLRQALVLRLLTPLGSLGELGHAGYGSRLHEVVGELNVETTRLRARSFVLQALAQERRVAEVLALEVLPPAPAAPDRLRIELLVAAAGSGDRVALGLEVGL